MSAFDTLDLNSFSTMVGIMKKLARYLQMRLNVDGEVAERLVRLAIKGERNYLLRLYGYDKLSRIGMDELDLLKRLKRPFVFGFFVKEVLESELKDDVKYKAALESWRSINLYQDEGVPAYLIKTINFLLNKEGFNHIYFETLIKLCLALPNLFEACLKVMSDELSDVEDLFNYVMSCKEVTVDDKIAFLAAILNLRDINEVARLKLYEKFLRSEHIPFNDKMELCKHAADLNLAKYLKNKLKPYLPDDQDTGLFDVPPYIFLLSMPSLSRRSIRWLAEAEPDKKRLVEKYFKERMEGYYEVYQTLGALDICKLYHRELGEEYCIDIFRRALRANRVEVRRTAEKYLKELHSQTLYSDA